MLGRGYRAFQQTIADSAARFKVAVIHRRAGKTVFSLDWLLEPARDPDWQCPNAEIENPYRGYYVAPYRNQAKGIALDFLKQQTAGDKVNINHTDLYAEFPETGARVQLLGADGFDKHRGRYANRVAFDETAQIPPAAWREVFRPMLADTEGEALFIGTPRGRGFLHHLFTMKERSPLWDSWLLRADESGILKDAELADMRADMTDADYRREMLCDWDVGVPGAYFTKQMDTLANAGRVIPGGCHNPSELVYASWALLPTDSIAVVYWQMEGRTAILIDADRFMQEPIEDVVKAVREKPYIYAGHVFRIDHMPNAEPTPFRLRAIRQLGLAGPVIPRREWVDEVTVIRQFLAGAKVAGEAIDAVEALRQVHAEFDEKRLVFRQEPDKDWTYDYAVAVSAFANYARRGRQLGRRDPIDYSKRSSHG